MKRGLDAATSGLLAGELFAGGGTMAAEAERLGYTVRVLCEKEPHLQALLKQKFKGADVQPDMYERPWIHWAECGLVIYLLIAGFACQPFSTAGKMLEQHDPRAYQVLLVIEAAIALQTSVLLLENVLGLVTNDWRHGVYSMIKVKLHVAGFRSHRAVSALDHEVAGDTGRDRAFLLFAKSEETVTHEMDRLKLATWAPKVWPQRTPVHDVGAVPWGRVRAGAPKQLGVPAAYITQSGADSLIGCAISTNCSEALWRVMSQSECGTL
jgi:site-specific DNA-cytosine methylase